MTCCPDHPRIEGIETSDGRPVSDLPSLAETDVDLMFCGRDTA